MPDVIDLSSDSSVASSVGRAAKLSSESSVSSRTFAEVDAEFRILMRELDAGASLSDPLSVEPLQVDYSMAEASRERDVPNRSEEVSDGATLGRSQEARDRAEFVGHFELPDGTSADMPGRSMSEREIELKLLRRYNIPAGVKLRPLRPLENPLDLPSGCALLHEAPLKVGLKLPLLPCVQYLLSELNLALGQISMNMWRVLLSMLTLWRLSGCDFPTVAEVLYFWQATHLTRVGCRGTAHLAHRRQRRKIIEDIPNSSTKWRHLFCVVESGWEFDTRVAQPQREFMIPSRFQNIIG